MLILRLCEIQYTCTHIWKFGNECAVFCFSLFGVIGLPYNLKVLKKVFKYKGCVYCQHGDAYCGINIVVFGVSICLLLKIKTFYYGIWFY